MKRNEMKTSILRFTHIGDLALDNRIKFENPQALLQAKNQPSTIILNHNKDEAKIGRKSNKMTLDLHLESAINLRMISRLHVRIQRLRNGNFILYDHSVNGTYVNYRRVKIRGIILKHYDIVCFGHLNGANLKPGQRVIAFKMDLKYRVEIINIEGENCVKKEKQKSTEKKVEKINKQTKVKTKKSMLDCEDNCENSDYPNNVKRQKLEFQSLTISEKKSPIQKSVKGENSKKSIPKSTRKRKIGDEAMETELSVNEVKKVKKKGKKLNKRKNSSKVSDDSDNDNEEDDSEMCCAPNCFMHNDILGVIDWIFCDECKKWFHQLCVNFEDILEEDERYRCPSCSNNNN